MYDFLLLPVLLLLGISAQDVYYVKPTDSSLANCQYQPCLTIDQYLEEKDRYFTSYSMFIFLGGNHTVQAQVNLTRISHVELRGIENGSNVNIICTNEVTFYCQYVSHLRIEKLTFLLSQIDFPKASLGFVSSSGVIISNLRFQGSKSANISTQAISFDDSSISITNCSFEGNAQILGGGLLDNGGKLVLSGNTFNGSQAQYGGAVHCISCSILLIQNNFTSNSASHGGAIYCIWCSNMDLADNIFTKNEATFGGAIFTALIVL